jgi:hypothetical protein
MVFSPAAHYRMFARHNEWANERPYGAAGRLMVERYRAEHGVLCVLHAAKQRTPIVNCPNILKQRGFHEPNSTQPQNRLRDEAREQVGRVGDDRAGAMIVGS